MDDTIILDEFEGLVDLPDVEELPVQEEVPKHFKGAIYSFPKGKRPLPASLVKSDRDRWKVAAFGADGKPVEGFEVHWRPDNPFAESPRVLLTTKKLTRKEQRLNIEAMEEQVAHDITQPRLMVPEGTANIVVSRDIKNPRPGDVFSATWQVVPLEWERRVLSLPEDWTVPSSLVETFPGYDWERLRGYELQPWETVWAMPYAEWRMEFGRRGADAPVEAYWRYVRVLEPLPFPDDSEDSVRFMALLVRLSEPDEWIGQRIYGRNLIPAAVAPTLINGIDPHARKGFRPAPKRPAPPPTKRGQKPAFRKL